MPEGTFTAALALTPNTNLIKAAQARKAAARRSGGAIADLAEMLPGKLLAELLGCDPELIRNILYGKARPTQALLDTALALKPEVQKNLRALLFGEKTPPVFRAEMFCHRTVD